MGFKKKKENRKEEKRRNQQMKVSFYGEIGGAGDVF